MKFQKSNEISKIEHFKLHGDPCNLNFRKFYKVTAFLGLNLKK